MKAHRLVRDFFEKKFVIFFLPSHFLCYTITYNKFKKGLDRKLKRLLLVLVGSLSFGIGSIGALIPVLPTTPFLLLAAFCFARSSQRFDTWLQSTKIYQFYAADYVATKSIPRRKKWTILTNIYILMGASILIVPLIWVKWILFGLIIFLTTMILVVIPDKHKEP